MTPIQDVFPSSDHQDIIPSGDLEIGRKVDVMFIIDRSGTMRDDHKALRENIEAFIPELEKELSLSNVDCRLGLLSHDVSLEWPWRDLSPGTVGFAEKLRAIRPGDLEECTPQAIDFAVEHAAWDPTRRSFMIVMTDEAAEDGMDCTLAEFETVMAKLAAKGISLLFIGMPECFGTDASTKVYDRIRDYPGTFISERLHEDRGEKLIKWLAHSVSETRRFSPPDRGTSSPTDVFGLFHLVTTI